MRPLKWLKAKDGESWYSHAFGGFVCYYIRQMRDGRFAIKINSMEYDAKSTWNDAASYCEDHRLKVWESEK